MGERDRGGVGGVASREAIKPVIADVSAEGSCSVIAFMTDFADLQTL